MEATIPTELLMRFLRATPKQQAAIDRFLARNGDGEVGAELVTHARGKVGRLEYSADFNEVWLGGKFFDLSSRARARHCIQYLVECDAFDAQSARHLEKEIDPYVREKCQLPPAAEIKIQHYFTDADGKLKRLRTELVKAAGRNGRFYLNVR